MSERFSEEEIKVFEDELDDIFGGSDEELGQLAQKHARLRAIVGKAEKEKTLLAQRIQQKLEEAGLDSATAGGRRVGFQSRTYYGVAKGEGIGEYHDNLKNLKSWLEDVAPEVNIPASTNIGKAVQAFLDDNPGAEVPAFVSVTQARSLTNREA